MGDDAWKTTSFTRFLQSCAPGSSATAVRDAATSTDDDSKICWKENGVQVMTGAIPYFDPGNTDAAHWLVKLCRERYAGGAAKRDDLQTEGQLLLAAISMLVTPGESLWPWPDREYPDVQEPFMRLLTAAVFVAAEADRIGRASLEGRPVTSGLIMLGMDAEEIMETVDGLRDLRSELETFRQRR